MAVNNKIKWIIIHVLCHRRCHVPVRSQDLKVIGQSLCFSMSFPPLFFIYQHSGHFLKFYVYYLDWLHSRGVYRLSIAFVFFILGSKPSLTLLSVSCAVPVPSQETKSLVYLCTFFMFFVLIVVACRQDLFVLQIPVYMFC